MLYISNIMLENYNNILGKKNANKLKHTHWTKTIEKNTYPDVRSDKSGLTVKIDWPKVIQKNIFSSKRRHK